MKRFLSIAMLLAFALCGRAQTQENRTALYGNVSTSLAPGQPGGISAIQLQAVMNNVIASSYNPLSDGTVQPLNANLTSLAGLTYSSLGFVKMSAAGTFSLDTNTYLTSSTGVSSITGTAGQITASASTGAVTLSIPTAMTGITSITAPASTDLTLNAGSGNQNVNLLPTGTGYVGTVMATGSATIVPATYRIGSTDNSSSWLTNTNWGNMDFYSGDASGAGATVRARIGARMDNALGSAVDLVFSASGGSLVDYMFLQNNGNLLLGSATDNANGLFQIAASTTATAGIAFGNDTPQASIYRSAASTLTTPAQWAFTNSTASTSKTTGAIVSNGGLGVAGAAWIGGNLYTGLVHTFSGGSSITDNGSGGIAIAATGTNNVALNPSGTGVVAIGKGLQAAQGLFLQGSSGNFTSGSGLELIYTGGYGLVRAYNRTGSTGLPLVLNDLGGNVLINTITDSGNGRLQLSAGTTSASGIGFGTDTSLFRSGAYSLTLGGDANTYTFLAARGTTQPSSVGLTAGASSGSLAFTSDTGNGYYWGRILSGGNEIVRVYYNNLATIANVGNAAGLGIGGGLTVAATTASTSTTSGSGVFAGGLGVTGNINAGGTGTFAGAVTTGTAGSTVGSVVFNNATSGNITVSPPTGALGTVALTLPGSSGIIALSNNASDVQTIAAGTAYTLTGSNAAVTFGTTSPTVTLTAAGVYKITVTLQTSLVGATYASAFNSVTYNLYRTNNTPAAIPGTTFSNILNMVALTTQTITGPSESMSVLYTTANTSDIIGVQGLVSATPSAGSATCSAATINAVWLHP